jgi:hypothetical protein
VPFQALALRFELPAICRPNQITIPPCTPDPPIIRAVGRNAL